jgi:hypothetical protein
MHVSSFQTKCALGYSQKESISSPFATITSCNGKPFAKPAAEVRTMHLPRLPHEGAFGEGVGVKGTRYAKGEKNRTFFEAISTETGELARPIRTDNLPHTNQHASRHTLRSAGGSDRGGCDHQQVLARHFYFYFFGARRCWG